MLTVRDRTNPFCPPIPAPQSPHRRGHCGSSASLQTPSVSFANAHVRSTVVFVPSTPVSSTVTIDVAVSPLISTRWSTIRAVACSGMHVQVIHVTVVVVAIEMMSRQLMEPVAIVTLHRVQNMRGGQVNLVLIVMSARRRAALRGDRWLCH